MGAYLQSGKAGGWEGAWLVLNVSHFFFFSKHNVPKLEIVSLVFSKECLRRIRHPTPVFLPSRESHGQRSLMGYSPRGSQSPDMTEAT